MENDKIIIKGARENNLKNINLEIPRNKLVVFTGVSGCGKSTLAFDTIYAEGQRRYIESLSSYARQFLGQNAKPDVDSIEGLSPAISIDQKQTNHNPRSTVGTVTEIYDYLRLLYAKIGVPFCPHCKKPIKTQTIDQIIDKIMKKGEGSKIVVSSPVVIGQKGSHAELLENLRKGGLVRIKVDGENKTLDEEIVLNKNTKHTISVVVDRLVMKSGIDARLSESVELAIKLSDGLVDILEGENLERYSTRYSCEKCGYSIDELSPRLFSFNSPYGACETCAGLGFTIDVDEELVLKNKDLSVKEGAFNMFGWNYESGGMAQAYFNAIAKRYKIDLSTPIKNLPRKQLDIFLYGNGGEILEMKIENGRTYKNFSSDFEGLVVNLKRRFKETTSEFARREIERYMKNQKCKTCGGKRLSTVALSIKIDGKDISEMCDMPIKNLKAYLENVKLSEYEDKVAFSILKEIKARLTFLIDVGLSYLTLSRSAESLSGGESQRIRLATQIGSGLTGVLYILDEPSIGLHQLDNEKLLKTLIKLRDLGNSLIVVEHDEDTIRAADFIVDIGPFAGEHGGAIVATGSAKDIMGCQTSLTGDYLSGRKKIEIPEERKSANLFLEVFGAKQNNLKNIDIKIPSGCLTCITGVSGSGKSSLVSEIIYPALANNLNRARLDEGQYEKICGYENFDKVINIDQSPIGRTPRSNPATYTGVFTPIRELFAMTKDAKEKGYSASRFSFNVAGGRCANCDGDGVKKIEMFFLPDIEVVCEVCKGKRYNRETLQVKYKGKNISEVLDLTVEKALSFFENIPSIKNKIQALYDVGLGYIKLGQSSTTLSGGEAQRVKLASELAKRGTGKTVYILDEPTTGLHIDDVNKLVKILNVLTAKGNTVIVIEHNLDVIKVADYIIDLGPSGGDEGGEIVAVGTPEQIAKNKKSFTGVFLKGILENK